MKTAMEFTVYEKLRYELFEQLFPVLLCTGTEEEKTSTLHFMIHNGNEFVHDSFEELCDMDGVEYPYAENDFKVNYFKRGGVNYVQILLPEIEVSKGMNDILRAYVLYSEVDGKIERYKYFIIKKFVEGNKTAILNVSSEKRGLLGHDLTNHVGDMDYEYWALVNNYATLLSKDFEEEEMAEQTESE